MTTAEYLRGWNDCMTWFERCESGALGALIAMVDARMAQGDDPWWNDEQRAVWSAFRRAVTRGGGA